MRCLFTAGCTGLSLVVLERGELTIETHYQLAGAVNPPGLDQPRGVREVAPDQRDQPPQPPPIELPIRSGQHGGAA